MKLLVCRFIKYVNLIIIIIIISSSSSSSSSSSIVVVVVKCRHLRSEFKRYVNHCQQMS